jgi:Mo-co oxidoreductase dimerisation domain
MAKYRFRSLWGIWDYVDGKPVRRALGEMKLKSEIFRLSAYETLVPNQAYTVFGAVWVGETEVTEVSVSTDGGRTWAQAEFVDPVQRYAWRRWKSDWVTPKKPGQYTLLSRAKDTNGSVQPDKHDENYANYAINHLLPIDVTVEADL